MPSGSYGMHENTPTPEILQMSLRHYCLPVASVAEVATHFDFDCFFLSKKIVDTPGSPGMLENTPTPEIPQMSVCQYCFMASKAGVATHSFHFCSSKNFYDTSGSSGMLENTPTCEIPLMSVSQCSPVASLAGVATYFDYFFLSKNLSDTSGSSGMLKNTPTPKIQYHKCQFKTSKLTLSET